MKEKGSVIIIILVILAVLGMGGAYYYFTKIAPEKNPLFQVATPTPAISQSLPTSIPTQTLSPVVSQSQFQLPAKTGSKTFVSQNLGLAFYYAEKVDNIPIGAKEEGNKVYVYFDRPTDKYTSGQSIEVYSKSPGDSLTQAITKQFLSGISKDKCYVEEQTGNTDKLLHAQILYPKPTQSPGESEAPPWFAGGNECPENYKMTNGIRYFAYDTNIKDHYAFLSIGQYGIPSQNGATDKMWQDTLVFFSK